MSKVRENLRLAQVEIALVQKDNRIEDLEARIRQLEACGSHCPDDKEFRLDDDAVAALQLLAVY